MTDATGAADGTAPTQPATASETEPFEPEGRATRIARIALAIIFGLFFAYVLFQAISNAVALPQYYQLIGIGDAVPWWLLILGIAVPPLLFTAAYLTGRRQPLFAQALIYVVALAANYALTLSIVTLAPVLLDAHLQGL